MCVSIKEAENDPSLRMKHAVILKSLRTADEETTNFGLISEK